MPVNLAQLHPDSKTLVDETQYKLVFPQKHPCIELLPTSLDTRCGFSPASKVLASSPSDLRFLDCLKK